MPSATVEDYVKAIYAIQRDAPTGEATVAGLAAILGVTKGTVTAMVRKLRDAGLADAERYGGIRLRPKGRRLALDVVRRHRLIEVFLVEKLGFDWSEVHEEAERLEHAMSAKMLDRLDEYLGRPAIDPHGDPIPDAAGRIAEQDTRALADLAAGESARVVRVLDQDPGFLTFLAGQGLVPGAAVRVATNTPESGSLAVEVPGGEVVPMSLDAARRVHVAPDTEYDNPDKSV